jgi:glycosyltransferase involved in cell wall biosynthesis
MTLRILFAIHGPRDAHTAVYLTVLRRAAFLERQGHSVDVLTPGDLLFGSVPRLQPLLLPLGLASRSLREYDVVIFHSYLAWAHQVRRLARPVRAARPVTVVAFHGLEPLYHEAVAAELSRTNERLSRRFHVLHRMLLPRLLKFACGRAHRVFCLNSAERAFLVAHGWTEPSRVVVLPNGVEEDLLRHERIYESRANRLLFTGQWVRAKGIRYLARAFEAIAAESPVAELTCLGTGADRETVLQTFVPGVHQRIRVLPRVDREELARELARADLFMFPSLSEGFSGALVEAMAAALPVIATNVGAAADLLTDGRNALVVPAADADALAAAATRLLSDPTLRRRLGASAQTTAQRYEWTRVNQTFAAEILQAVGEVA